MPIVIAFSLKKIARQGNKLSISVYCFDKKMLMLRQYKEWLARIVM